MVTPIGGIPGVPTLFAILIAVIAGFFLIIEDQYGLGDTIRVGGVSGTVEDIQLRVTVLRDIDALSGSGVFRDEATDERARALFFAGEIPNFQVIIPDFGTVEQQQAYTVARALHCATR